MATRNLTIQAVIDNRHVRSGIDNMKKIVSAGVKATVASIGTISAALVSTRAAFVKFGSEFTSSFAKPTTLFGDVDVNIGKLQNDILTLSNASGEAASSLNEGLYSALSAGVPITEDATEAINFLTKANKLAVAGFTDTDTAITATAKTLNAYGYGLEETDRIQKVLIQTQNKGITTVDELGKNLSKVTPIAAAYGVSIEEVGAALATLTAKGVDTATATTYLKNLFTEMGKSGTAFSETLKAMTSTVKPFTESELAALKESNEAVYSAQEEAYKSQEEQLEESLETQYNELEKHLDKQYDTASKGYDNEIENAKRALTKQEDNLKSSYDSRISALKSERDEYVDIYKESVDNQLKIIDKNNKEYLDNIVKTNNNAISELKSSQSQELEVLNSAHEEKLKLINSEYTEKLKLYDEDKYKAITAINEQIEAIKNKTKAEDAAIKARNDADKISELESKIQSSNGDERLRYEKELADFRENLAREVVLAEREEQIDMLNERKKAVEDEYNTKVDALKQEVEKRVELEKTSYDKSKSALTEKQAAELEALKEQQEKAYELTKERLNAERDEFVSLSKDKIELLEDEYQNRIDMLTSERDVELSNLREINDVKLSVMRENADEQLALLKEQHDVELKNLEDVNNRRLDTFKKTNELSLQSLSDSQEANYQSAKLGSQDGKTFSELLGNGDTTFVEILQDVKQYAEETGIAFETLFSSSESYQAVLGLLSGDAQTFNADLEAMNVEADLVTEGYNKMAETLENKTQRLQQSFKNIGTGVFLNVMNDDLMKAADVAQYYMDKIYDVVSPSSSGEAKTPDEILRGLFDVALGAFSDLKTYVIENLPSFIDVGLTVIQNIADGIVNSLSSLADVLPQIGVTITEKLPTIFGDLLAGVDYLLTDLAPSLIDIVVDLVLKVLDELPNYVTTILSTISTILTTIIDYLVENADNVVSQLVDFLVYIIDALITFLTGDEFDKFLQALLDFIVKIILAIVKAIPKLLDLLTDFQTDIFEAIVKLFTALVPVIIQAAFTLVNEIVKYIPSLFEELISLMTENNNDRDGAINNFAGNLINLLWTALKEAIYGLAGLGEAILGWFGFDNVMEKSEQFGINLHKKLESIFDKVKTVVNNVKGFPDTVNKWLNEAGPKLESFKQHVVDSAADAISDFKNKFESSDIGMEVSRWLDSAKTSLLDFGVYVADKAKEAFNNFMSGLDVLSSIGDNVKNKLDNVINVILNWGTDLYNKGKDSMLNFISGIKDSFSNIGNEFEDIGKNLMDGIGNGIDGAKNWVTDKVSSLTDNVKDAFGIHSPSKVWEKEVGYYLGEGLVKGFEDDNPVKQIEGIMNSGVDKLNIRASINAAMLNAPSGGYTQTINFNGNNASSPDEIARAIRLQSKYGLAGAY